MAAISGRVAGPPPVTRSVTHSPSPDPYQLHTPTSSSMTSPELEPAIHHKLARLGIGKAESTPDLGSYLQQQPELRPSLQTRRRNSSSRQQEADAMFSAVRRSLTIPSLSIAIPPSRAETAARNGSNDGGVAPGAKTAAKTVTFVSEEEDAVASDDSSICQSPSWEEWGRKKKKKSKSKNKKSAKEEAGGRKDKEKDKKQTDPATDQANGNSQVIKQSKEASSRSAAKRLTARLTKIPPAQHSFPPATPPTPALLPPASHAPPATSLPAAVDEDHDQQLPNGIMKTTALHIKSSPQRNNPGDTASVPKPKEDGQASFTPQIGVPESKGVLRDAAPQREKGAVFQSALDFKAAAHGSPTLPARPGIAPLQQSTHVASASLPDMGLANRNSPFLAQTVPWNMPNGSNPQLQYSFALPGSAPGSYVPGPAETPPQAQVTPAPAPPSAHGRNTSRSHPRRESLLAATASKMQEASKFFKSRPPKHSQAASAPSVPRLTTLGQDAESASGSTTASPQWAKAGGGLTVAPQRGDSGPAQFSNSNLSLAATSQSPNWQQQQQQQQQHYGPVSLKTIRHASVDKSPAIANPSSAARLGTEHWDHGHQGHPGNQAPSRPSSSLYSLRVTDATPSPPGGSPSAASTGKGHGATSPMKAPGPLAARAFRDKAMMSPHRSSLPQSFAIMQASAVIPPAPSLPQNCDGSRQRQAHFGISAKASGGSSSSSFDDAYASSSPATTPDVSRPQSSRDTPALMGEVSQGTTKGLIVADDTRTCRHSQAALVVMNRVSLSNQPRRLPDGNVQPVSYWASPNRSIKAMTDDSAVSPPLSTPTSLADSHSIVTTTLTAPDDSSNPSLTPEFSPLPGPIRDLFAQQHKSQSGWQSSSLNSSDSGRSDSSRSASREEEWGTEELVEAEDVEAENDKERQLPRPQKQQQPQPQEEEEEPTTSDSDVVVDTSFLPALRHEPFIPPKSKARKSRAFGRSSDLGGDQDMALGPRLTAVIEDPTQTAVVSGGAYLKQARKSVPVPLPAAFTSSLAPPKSIMVASKSLRSSSGASLATSREAGRRSEGLATQSMLITPSLLASAQSLIAAPPIPPLPTLPPQVSAAGHGSQLRVSSNDTVTDRVGQQVAKMLVECCSCRFFHDMPSRVYECMVNPDAVVEDRTLGISGAITTMVKCPWCAHNMNTSCCAGYATVIQLKERLH